MALVTEYTALQIGFDQRAYESRAFVTISSTTGGVALPFFAEFTGDITRVVMPISSVSTAVSNLQVGIQAMSTGTSGLPSGTFLATPNIVSLPVQTFNSNTVLTLTNPVSVTKGNIYYIVFLPNGSFTGNVNIHYNMTSIAGYNALLRTAIRTASSWVRNVNGSSSSAFYGSSTKWYGIDQASTGAQSSYSWTVTFTNGSANIGGTFNTLTTDVDTPVRLTTTGTLPTNFATNTTYFIKTVSASTITLSATRGGAAISAGSSGSGTHTMTATITQNDEIGFAFTLNANHPAIRVKQISTMNTLHNATTGGNPGMTFSLKQYDASGTLLNTFQSIDTDRMSTTTGVGTLLFTNSTSNEIWLEPGTKYYFLLAFTGTFTNPPTDWRVYDYDSTFQDVNGAYTSNQAFKYPTTIVEDTNSYWSFGMKIDAIRYDNSSGGGGGGYANASPMFSGGFSG